MYKCGNCGINSEASEKMTKVVVEKRNKIYTGTFGEVIGQGWEIVKEIGVCLKCALHLKDRV